jgi:hypothetical protein
MFWDIGLEIGHSVRTVEACVESRRADITDRDLAAGGAAARRQRGAVPAPVEGASTSASSRRPS